MKITKKKGGASASAKKQPHIHLEHLLDVLLEEC